MFFGLSGTGKTTLSADPKRKLIGDDEHGWSNDGVFNFEGGCYAKLSGFLRTKNRRFTNTTRRFGTILENVVYDPVSRYIDLDDDKITENTRCSYPLEFIPNIVPEGYVRTHPKNIIFVSCDASGVVPPIARLNPEQAQYHFISGSLLKLPSTAKSDLGLNRR